MGEPAFRGKQVFTWLHQGVTSFDEMSNLSKASAGEAEGAVLSSQRPPVARKQVSSSDGTIKYLWQLLDGNCIETVLMQLPPRKHRVHLLPGGLPDGLRLLRLHHCWQGEGPDTV